MKLARIDEHAAQVIMTWIPDERACKVWGGPGMRYPFTASTFVEDAKFNSLPSYALVDANHVLMACGQYYRYADRCHLARLMVNPGHRGQGLGHQLISKLLQAGARELQTPECSLFVYRDNVRAVHLYEQLGFVQGSMPDESRNVAEVQYMTAAVKDILEQVDND